uniref:Nuclear speckle splicing regulatory protein 1 n=1 Tax=Geotrypetes seraphini TaxID=260995 RepID=A0A6P8PT75_GEOSA|nr:nuclear speckle splicing regulatory protein 1 [Geotrypetes seraphini]
MAAPKKQYGLILPKKIQQKLSEVPRHAAFAEDSDEEESVGESLQKEALKKRVMKQTKLEMQKALEEDATVYEYDSIYMDLQRKKEENNAKLLSVKDKKPKYIQSLLKAVEMRKKEQERRTERKVQKEREMEGEEFKDKEAFVTSAYKKKLQERAEEDERERREAALEASLDVTKQKDLSGFYRHLLNQTVGEEQTPECSLREIRVKEEKVKGYADEPSQIKRSQMAVHQEKNPDADSDLGSDSSSGAEDKEVQKGDQVLASKKNLVSSDEDSSHDKQKEAHGGESHSHWEQKKSHRKGDGEMDQKEKDDEHEEKCEKPDRKEKEEHFSTRNYRTSEEEVRQRERDRKESNRSKEHKRERDKNGKDGRSRERSEKCRDKARERSEKHRQRQHPTKDEKREKIEKTQEREESSSLPSEKERQPGWDKDEALVDNQNPESSARLSGLPETKRKAAEEEGADEGTEPAEREPDNVSKFAKRSNEETILSARDRYLARQMARVSAKPYIEKEED